MIVVVFQGLHFQHRLENVKKKTNHYLTISLKQEQIQMSFPFCVFAQLHNEKCNLNLLHFLLRSVGNDIENQGVVLGQDDRDRYTAATVRSLSIQRNVNLFI